MGRIMTRLLAISAFLCVAVCIYANETSCGGDRPSKVKDCDKPDTGSCGNACCIMDFTLATNTTYTYDHFKAWLMKGGNDGSYAYVTGPDKAGHNPGDDLSKYGIPWDFIFQGTHTTIGGYVDKIDFNLAPVKGGGTKMRASTISGIHGALGDNGQTYKTLMAMWENRHSKYSFSASIVHGCGSGPVVPTCLHHVDLQDHKCFEACNLEGKTFASRGLDNAGTCPDKYDFVEKTKIVTQCPDGVSNLRYCKGNALNVTIKTKGTDSVVSLSDSVTGLPSGVNCKTDTDCPCSYCKNDKTKTPPYLCQTPKPGICCKVDADCKTNGAGSYCQTYKPKSGTSAMPWHCHL